MIWSIVPAVWFSLGMLVAAAGAVWGPDEGPSVLAADPGRVRFLIIATLLVLGFIVAWPLFIRFVARCARDRWRGQVTR